MTYIKHTNPVSIILPTYNRADRVGKAIESVLAQTYTDFELLVIDDVFIEMQTDNEKILERFETLPFKHKIAFVPFETTSESAVSLKCFPAVEKKGIACGANDLAAGLVGYYNILKLLNGEEDFCRLRETD